MPSKTSLERGLAALAEGDHAGATRALTEAFRQSPRPELLYHLGRVATAQGQALVAYDLFRRYLADPSREPDEAASKLAEEAIASPPPVSGSIAIQSDPGAIVFVDERIVGTLPLPLPVLLSPGPHSVVLEFPGKKYEAPVQVQASRVSELRISRGSGAVLLSVLPAILLATAQPVLAPEASRRLIDTLEGAARAEQHTLLGLELLKSAATERDACRQSPRCLSDLAQSNKLSWILQGRIVPSGEAQSPTWNINLRLLHVEVGEPAAVAELTCPSAKLEVALAALKEAAAKLFGAGLSRPRGSLKVSAQPSGATLRIGTGDALPLPYSGALWAGSYDVSVVLPGFRPHRQSVTIREESPSEVAVTLEAEVIGNELISAPVRAPRSRGPRPKLRLAFGGALIGIGLGMVAVGGIGLSKNGQCATEPEIAGANCEMIYKTALPGALTLGGGLLLAGTGVVLLALPGPWGESAAR